MNDKKQSDSLFHGRGYNQPIDSCDNIIELILNKKRDKAAHGEESYIMCPKCGKEIDYYWSGFAGVVKARCRTPGCFNWNKALIPRKKPKLVRRKKPKLRLRKKPKLKLRRRK